MTTLEKLEELIYVGFKERDAKIQALIQRIQELEVRCDVLERHPEKIWDGISSREEIFVEDDMLSAAYRLFPERGIVLHTQAASMMTERFGEPFSVGPFMAGKTYAVLLNISRKPDADSVNILVEELENFLRFFPEYQHHQVIGAIAGFTITEEIKMDAYQKGFFVIAQSGDTITILNDAKFAPKVWQQGAVVLPSSGV